MLESDALQLLLDTGKALSPKAISLPGEPPHIYGVLTPDGKIEAREASAAPVNRKVLSLETLASITNDHDSVAWVSPEAVVATIGERGRATLALTLSEPLVKIIDLKKASAGIDQPTILRYFKTTFHGCLGDNSTLVSSLRKIKVSSSKAATSEVNPGRRSLSAEMQEEMTGAGDIPEHVDFSVPVFANGSLGVVRATVKCSLDMDASNGTFRLTAVAGHIEAAIEYGLTAIREILDSHSVTTTYLGSP